jgi:hypothetical protein
MDVNAIVGQLMAVSHKLAKAMFGKASQPCSPTAEKHISASLKEGMQRRKHPDDDRGHSSRYYSAPSKFAVMILRIDRERLKVKTKVEQGITRKNTMRRRNNLVFSLIM